MERVRTNADRIWLLMAPEGRRIGLVSRDASLPVAMSRLGRNWDLIGEHLGRGMPEVDAFVIPVAADEDPRRALQAYVDPEAATWGESATEVAGPATYLPRSAGLEELADTVARAFDQRPAEERTAASDPEIPPPASSSTSSEGLARDRFRDRLRERLSIGESNASVWLNPPSVDRAAASRSSAEDTALEARVHTLAEHLRELVWLVQDHPMLGDSQRVLARLMDVPFERLGLDSVIVWRKGPDGWTAQAHRGLPEDVPLPIIAPSDQVLLGGLDASGAGVLVHRIEETPEPVAGLPVDGRGSMVGVALTYAGERYGLLTATRPQPFEPDDLRALRAFTDEAMAGLAIATGVDLLRRSQETVSA